MNKTIISIVVLLFGLGSYVNAQDVLNFPSDAKTTSMGGIGLSKSTNTFSMYSYSGAVALDESKWAAGYSFGGWMLNGNMRQSHAIAGYSAISDKMALSAGVRYFILPSVEISDNNGNVIDDFSPHDFTVDLGGHYAINDNLALGVNARYVGSKISSSNDAMAFGFDVGAYYRKDHINAGVMICNVGSKLKYSDNSSINMPSRAKASVGYDYELIKDHKLYGTIETAYAFMPENETGFEAAVGVEYTYRDFIAIRGGYRLGNAKTDFVSPTDQIGSSLSYGTVGLGFFYKNYVFDLSCLLASENSPVKNSFILSMSTKF